MNIHCLPILLCSLALPAVHAETWLLVQTKQGTLSEVSSPLTEIPINVGGQPRRIPLTSILSIHNGAPASPEETRRITEGLAAIQGTDRKQSDAAVEQLSLIGIPVMTPLLQAYKDTDQHEPKPLYRLFERIIPSTADTFDRQLSLVRLTTGEMLRGKLESFTVSPDLNADNIRLLAVRQKSIYKMANVHSLRHSTQIEYLDTGIYPTAASKATVGARGFIRISWDTDGWACGPDGLQKPGPNYKTNMVDGQPFGALVGRQGASGDVFLVGSKFLKESWKPTAGHLQLAVNDNKHWQNNIGGFRAAITVSDAYDLRDAQ